MQGVRQWVARSWVVDVVVATPFVVVGQLAAWGVLVDGGSRLHGSPAVNAALSAVFDSAVVLRRRAPLPALAIMAVVGIGQTWYAETTGFFSGFVPIVLTVGAAAARESRRRSLAGLVFAFAILVTVVALAPDLYATNEIPFGGPVLWLSWLIGRHLQARERRAASAEARVVGLEAERERVLEEERARIARELHDVIAHSVSVMVVQTGAARTLLDEDPASARDALLAVERSGRQALEEMRRLLGILRRDQRESELVPQPGLGSVPALVQHVRAAGLPVALDVEGDAASLSPGIDLSAYRIVQEALTNTLKHARAGRARVRVAYRPTEVELEITDDGRGPAGRSDGGHGLVGMRERVELYGGMLVTGAGPHGGYRVLARLPLEAA